MRKVRTQIQFDAREYEKLKVEAERRDVSISFLVREAVRVAYGAAEDGRAARERFLAAAGIGREPDDADDVARRHDDHLHGPRPK